MDNRLLRLLEPKPVGLLRGMLRSYVAGSPTGRHSLTAPVTKPYAMPAGLRYRVRAAILRPKRENVWCGKPATECHNVQKCDIHFPKRGFLQ